MASSQFIKTDDIFDLDTSSPGSATYFGMDSKILTGIRYTALFPGSRIVFLNFASHSCLDAFIEVLKARFRHFQNPFEKYFQIQKIETKLILSKAIADEGAIYQLETVLDAACDYANIDESQKNEITSLPALTFPFPRSISVMGQLLELVALNYLKAKRIVDSIKQCYFAPYLWSQQIDFLHNLCYQLGLHCETNQAFDKAIHFYSQIDKENPHFDDAQLHKTRCNQLFMQPDQQSALVKEISSLRTEIAALNARLATLEKAPVVSQTDEKKQNASSSSTIFGKRQ